MGWLSSYVQSWIDWFYARQIAAEKRIKTLEDWKAKMTVEFDTMKASYEAEKTEIFAAVNSLLAKVADLTAQVASGGDKAAILALNDEITADRAAFAKLINPPAPDADPNAPV